MRTQTYQIILAGHAAGGDNGLAARLRHREDSFDVRPLHHAVTGNIGVDKRLGALGRQLLGQFGGKHLGGIQPAMRGDIAIACVNADGHLGAVLGQHALRKGPVVDRGGADNDAANAERQQLFHILQRPQTAADLNGHLNALRDGANQLDVDGMASLGAVQIDKVDELPALRLP
ncbi:hypothetical protein D3C71_1571660 [compost metagenome]